MVTTHKIKQILQQYRPKIFFAQRFESKTRSNFLNFVKKIKGEDEAIYVMKVPKRFTDILCFLRIGIFHLLGDNGIIYAPFSERIKNERDKIKFLNEKGIPSRPLADTETEGALVTKFVIGANLKDIFRDSAITFEQKLKILTRSSERLEDIHEYFSHNDAQVRNMLVTEANETIWLDYEYISNPDVPALKQKARDLIIFIFSAAKHLGNSEKVIETILNAYKGDEVKKIVLSLRQPYQSIGYNLFLNFLNPILCLKVRKALKKFDY